MVVRPNPVTGRGLPAAWGSAVGRGPCEVYGVAVPR